MIYATTGAGIPVRALKYTSEVGEYVLTAKGVIGRRTNIWGFGFSVSEQIVNSEWVQGPMLEVRRRRGYSGRRKINKRFFKIYAHMFTRDEAERVAGVMEGAKIGTKDFKMKLALITDELITDPNGNF